MLSSSSLSLLKEYFHQLYTNKIIIAMIMIILVVALILYVIKKINEFLEPPKEDEDEKKIEKENKAEAEVPKREVKVPMSIWSQKDFKKFQRRDLIDHYAFYFRLTLFIPEGIFRYRDNFIFHVREEDQFEQNLLDLFQRQADDNSCNGITYFEVADIEFFRIFINKMIEELKEAAENRIKFGYFGYAPFAGMHLEHALTLPKTTHGSKRFLSCGITLLCTEFTEPFYLQYKWKPRRNVAEEEETPVNLELEERASSEAEVEEEIATSEFQVVVEEEEVTPSEVEVLDEEEETPTPEFQVVVDEEEVTTSDVEVIDDVKEEESATPELKVTKEETVM